MKETTILVKKDVQLKKPVLIEGLPGIGLVGKLAAEHLIQELKAEKIAELYSPHFPHQVLMMKNGTVRLLKNKFYAWKNPKKNGNDILMLIGDVQAITSEAQFEISTKILDFLKQKGGDMAYTLGGYGVGKVVETPKVFGAVSHKKLVDEFKQYGIRFGEANGSIIGAAGLLLGLGKLQNVRGICLMGETHGGYVDPKSAQAVLEVLCKILDIKINLNKLEERAKKSERFMRKMEKEAEKQSEVTEGAIGGKELTYIR